MKALIAVVLAGATLGGGAYWYVSWGPGAGAPAIRVDVKSIENGKVKVSWTHVNSSDGAAVTGYEVRAKPDGTDRVPLPSLETPPAQRVSATDPPSANISGLLPDCHQRYQVVVTPETNAGSGPPAISRPFRPSGIVSPGRPPYVVILLDGIGESKPGFTMNPYDPTNKKEIPSYCPENVHFDGQPVINDFPHEPDGPWEFFRKWNFYDPSDTANDNDPQKNSNSTPRDLSHPDGQTPGRETHTFMLDAIAGEGAVILPFSYNGATLSGTLKHPQFTFPAYTACNSSPGGTGGPGCSRDPGGEPDPVSGLLSEKPVAGLFNKASVSWRISEDEQTLANEVASVRSVWRNVPIVVIGHSQGGLIAFDAWRDGLLPGILHGFSLDSPINGVCRTLGYQPPASAPGSLPPAVPGSIPVPGPAPGSPPDCVGPAGYNDFNDRFHDDPNDPNDPNDFRLDSSGVFRFIGTWGDEVPISRTLVLDGPAYGTGDETLQHELLVKENRPCTTATNNAGCPSPPDEISTWLNHAGINECKIPDSGWAKADQHFIVKFCPGNVNYFNTALGLSLDQAGPPEPARALSIMCFSGSGPVPSPAEAPANCEVLGEPEIEANLVILSGMQWSGWGETDTQGTGIEEPTHPGQPGATAVPVSVTLSEPAPRCDGKLLYTQLVAHVQGLQPQTLHLSGACQGAGEKTTARPGQSALVTQFGQVGPLTLGTSSAADVEAFAGKPEAMAQDSFEVQQYPPYQALGYGCSPNASPDRRSLTYNPSAPYCQTVYYLNSDTGRLAAFWTASSQFKTAGGTTPGDTAAAAAQKEGTPVVQGCHTGIMLGDQSTPAILVEDVQQGTVTDLAVESNSQAVGFLFC